MAQARQSYRTVSEAQGWDRNAALTVQGAINGKTNNITDVTLHSGTATTTVSFALIGPLSWIGIMPTSASAASEAPQPWVSFQDNGVARLTHVNSAVGTRSYRIIVFGG